MASSVAGKSSLGISVGSLSVTNRNAVSLRSASSARRRRSRYGPRGPASAAWTSDFRGRASGEHRARSTSSARSDSARSTGGMSPGRYLRARAWRVWCLQAASAAGERGTCARGWPSGDPDSTGIAPPLAPEGASCAPDFPPRDLPGGDSPRKVPRFTAPRGAPGGAEITVSAKGKLGGRYPGAEGGAESGAVFRTAAEESAVAGVESTAALRRGSPRSSRILRTDRGEVFISRAMAFPERPCRWRRTTSLRSISRGLPPTGGAGLFLGTFLFPFFGLFFLAMVRVLPAGGWNRNPGAPLPGLPFYGPPPRVKGMRGRLHPREPREGALHRPSRDPRTRSRRLPPRHGRARRATPRAGLPWW